MFVRSNSPAFVAKFGHPSVAYRPLPPLDAKTKAAAKEVVQATLPRLHRHVVVAENDLRSCGDSQILFKPISLARIAHGSEQYVRRQGAGAVKRDVRQAKPTKQGRNPLGAKSPVVVRMPMDLRAARHGAEEKSVRLENPCDFFYGTPRRINVFQNAANNDGASESARDIGSSADVADEVERGAFILDKVVGVELGSALLAERFAMELYVPAGADFKDRFAKCQPTNAGAQVGDLKRQHSRRIPHSGD